MTASVSFFHSTAPMRYSKYHSSRVEFTLNANYTHKSTIKFQTSIIVLSSHCNVKIFSFADSSLSSLIQLFIGCEWIEWRERDWGTERERESECLWSSFPKLKQFQNISNCFWRVWNVSSYQVNIERMSTKNVLLSFWWVLTVFRHKCMHTFDTLQTHSIKIRNCCF